MKFTRTLLAVSLLAATQMVSAQAEKPDAFVQQLLEKQYPHNEKALKAFNENKEGEEVIKQCHFKGIDGAEDKDAPIDGYCMNFVSEKIADTAQGKRRYIFFSGDKLVSCHGCVGLDSLFVFTSANGKDWQLFAHKETPGGSGSWGKSSTEAGWQETGPGLWGVITEVGLSQGGASEGSTQILHDDGKEIRMDLIPTLSYSTGAEDCNDKESLNIQSQEKCYESQTELKGTVEVRKDLPAVGNTYPVQVTLNGYDGMKLTGDGKDAKTQPIKEYKDKKFVFPYDAEKHRYVMPEDYPSSLIYVDDNYVEKVDDE